MLSAEERYRLLEEVSGWSSRGQFDAAIERLSTLEPEQKIAEPELGYLFAQALFRLERYEEALAWVRRLLRPCLRRGKDELYCRRLGLEGSLLFELGELREAEERFSEMFSVATHARYHKLQAHATMNLGAVACVRYNWEEAGGQFYRALAAYSSSGDEYHLAGCHHNLGIMWRQRGFFKESGAHLEQALARFNELGARREWLTSLTERALLTSAGGDQHGARALASRALRAFQERGDERSRGEAERAMGIIERESGNLSDCVAHLESALSLSRSTESSLLHAEVAEELAAACMLVGRDSDSAAFAAEATAIYEKMGAAARAERLRSRLS